MELKPSSSAKAFKGILSAGSERRLIASSVLNELMYWKNEHPALSFMIWDR